MLCGVEDLRSSLDDDVGGSRWGFENELFASGSGLVRGVSNDGSAMLSATSMVDGDEGPSACCS